MILRTLIASAFMMLAYFPIAAGANQSSTIPSPSPSSKTEAEESAKIAVNDHSAPRSATASAANSAKSSPTKTTDKSLATQKKKQSASKKHQKALPKKSIVVKKSTSSSIKKATIQGGVKAGAASKKNLSQVSLKSLSKPSELLPMPKLIRGEAEELSHKQRPSQSQLPKKEEISSPLDDEEDDEEEDEEEEEEEAAATPAPPSKKIMIRVLLKEASTEQKVTFAVQSNKGFVLESPIGSGKRARWQHQILNILAYEHNLFVLTEQGTYKRIKSNELAIASVDGDLKIDNYRYTGTVYLRIDPKTKMVQMVNKVNLDDYIYAVLRYESLSYWPLEMQKVQAIASRTYAVRQIKVARSSSNGMPFYDIKNNNFHQVYNGNHDYVHLRKAVEATHNLILTYNGDIALTMFDICCGGIIPGYMKKRDADKPYLFRKNRCTYCRDKANYEWNCSFDKGTLLQRMLDSSKLSSKAKKLGKIVGISLKEKDRAGIVHRVLLHGSRNNISFTNNEFKAALGARAKSSAYTVKKLQDDIVVHGYGFGHNMGLCQIGARELISRGWNYQEVLDFYFPKTRLMRLKVI